MSDGRLAAHEAGHLVVAATSPHVSSASSLIEGGASGLIVCWAPIAEHDDRRIEELVIHMAGMAGEIVAFGAPWREGFDLDLAEADKICRTLKPDWSLLEMSFLAKFPSSAERVGWIMRAWQSARFSHDHDPYHRDLCIAALGCALRLIGEGRTAFDLIRNDLQETGRCTVPASSA